MAQIARFLTDAEMKAAAQYFIGHRVEAVGQGGRERHGAADASVCRGPLHPLGQDTEPLGRRFIEVPEFPDRTERLRDPKAGFGLTCHSAPSDGARRSSRPVAVGPCSARHATARICWAWVMCRRSPTEASATPSGSYTTISRARDTARSQPVVSNSVRRHDRDRRVSRLAITRPLWRLRCGPLRAVRVEGA